MDRTAAARKAWETRRNLSAAILAPISSSAKPFPSASSDAIAFYNLSANGLFLARVQLTDDQASFLNDKFTSRRQPLRYATA
jgi:hypothetical protein